MSHVFLKCTYMYSTVYHQQKQAEVQLHVDCVNQIYLILR